MSRSVVRLHYGGYWVSQVFGPLCKCIFIATFMSETFTMQVHKLSHKCLANGLQA